MRPSRAAQCQIISVRCIVEGEVENVNGIFTARGTPAGGRGGELMFTMNFTRRLGRRDRLAGSADVLNRLPPIRAAANVKWRKGVMIRGAGRFGKMPTDPTAPSSPAGCLRQFAPDFL